MSALTFTWDVTCPKCGAPPGRRCRDRQGDRMKFHVDRSRAASSATGTVKIVPGQWSWDRPCPWCGAETRQPCRTRAGKATATHTARTDRRTAR